MSKWIHNIEGIGWDAHQLRRPRRWLGIPLLPKMEYEVTINDLAPLTFNDGTGVFWRTRRRRFTTDFGTVPPPFSLFIPSQLYPASFIFHDEAWGEGGLMAAPRMSGPWEFRKLSRWESNRMLWGWVNTEGGRGWTCAASAVIQGGAAIGATAQTLKSTVMALVGHH